MKFIDLAQKGNNKAGSYLLTIGLLVLAYLVASVLILVDLKANFNLDLTSNFDEASIIATMGKNRFFFWILIPFLFAALALIFGVNKVHERPILSLFTARVTFDWKRFFFSFTLYGAILLLFFYLQTIGNPNLKWQFDPEKFLPLFLIALVFIPIQTACEELIFRSYLMQGLKMRTGNNAFSVLLAGTMFGLMHLGNPEIQQLGYGIIVYYIISGIFLNLIAHADDGIELSLGYHVANNLLTALLVTNNWQAFQTDALYLDTSLPSFTWDMFLMPVIVFPLMYFIFSKKYSWASIKVLFGKGERS